LQISAQFDQQVFPLNSLISLKEVTVLVFNCRDDLS